jgi:hypothetical protein
MRILISPWRNYYYYYYYYYYHYSPALPSLSARASFFCRFFTISTAFLANNPSRVAAEVPNSPPDSAGNAAARMYPTRNTIYIINK